MLGENAQQLKAAVRGVLSAVQAPTEAQVAELVEKLRKAFVVDDAERDAVIRELHAEMRIVMELGTALVDTTHVPWLAARRSEIDPFYWERHRVWLQQNGLGGQVVQSLDQNTDTILDLIGDPRKEGAWDRRGLVVGDVQSGKTGTYAALACKASDAGYRMIILLTGSLENLRRQTQARMDEAFVGLDSAIRLDRVAVAADQHVGVGLIDQRRVATVFTSRTRDFNRQLLDTLGLRLSSQNEPVLVVMKKNKSVIANLTKWLASYNADGDGRIGAPLLLIDDEADAASVNTAARDADAPAINKGVRQLLELFRRSSYVGFTATPFANIFVDPESDSEMLGDSLFPRDFIYALEAPSNYFGPARVFDGVGTYTRPIDDAAEYFPAGHGSGHQVTGLPESLDRALLSFLVATTLRDLRGEGPTHRSMLVNVSAYTGVQDQVAGQLQLRLDELKRQVRLHAGLDPTEALRTPAIRDLHDVWSAEHRDPDITWPDVQTTLRTSIEPVQVRAINQRTGAASLNYLDYRDSGLRVVAVGGNALSRGLTLEGLSTSYFYRNSQMYDTLLQMGRWFGYRDRYLDLCRIWIAPEAEAWYAHITEATDELRDELKRMRRAGLTPKDFGLKVRAHPDALLVTARNKMRTAQTVIRRIELTGRAIESTRLSTNPATLQANHTTADRWIRRLVAAHGDPGGRPRVWTGIPVDLVADLLADFRVHALDYDLQTDFIVPFLRSREASELSVWDVALPEGSGEAIEIGGLRLQPQVRYVLEQPATSSILVSGMKARVASRGAEKLGMTAAEIRAAEATVTTGNVSDHTYRSHRKRPLLLLHLLNGRTTDANGSRDPGIPWPADRTPIAALTVSFPMGFSDAGVRTTVEYKVNIVEWRAMFEAELGDEKEDDDEG